MYVVISNTCSCMWAKNVLNRLLTHCGLATPFVVIDGGYIGFDRGLSLVRYPSHYLNQCWVIVNWTHSNKFPYFSLKCIWMCFLLNGAQLCWSVSLKREFIYLEECSWHVIGSSVLYPCISSTTQWKDSLASLAAYLRCDEVRDILLWPSDLYSPEFTDQFRRALGQYNDDSCISIKQQLQNSSFIFSFKLRYALDLPQIRIQGRNMICEESGCINGTPAVAMIHSPADIVPDDRNLFYPGAKICPFVKRKAGEDFVKCHFLCSCEQWADENGFCDSQFVVVISSAVVSSVTHEVKLCGIKERNLSLWAVMQAIRNVGCAG